MGTIFAEATPPGRGGVSIIRLSGAEARQVGESLCGNLPEARHCYFRLIRDGDDLIDQALVFRFDAGSSFTGEESFEFQLHGAPVVARRLEAALISRGLRRAEPGEFTMRAFMSGRMDLAEVEGLSDLLAAETEAQRKLAAETSSGALGKLAESWRSDLLNAGALLTASIDFADEEIPDDVARDVGQLISSVRESIATQLAGFPASARLREGFEVALVGAPNAGKSSLLNAFARRDIAIVTAQPGTTRDVVEFSADLRGLPVRFLDTAGMRQTSDDIEKIGVERARKRAEEADLRLFVGEIPEDASDLIRDGDMFVRSKADLTGEAGAVSSVTGIGIEELLDRIFDVLQERVAGAGLASHERQAEALARAAAALKIDPDAEPEFLVEALREAGQYLQRLVGKIDAEDYFDQVFSSFCVGK
ncbi:tRNA uridine-5-carboxymethylaminomethyl(34) synthesis GTPase MnmE [Paracoccus sp. SCSIO 75233]|uniref:tRNA uridine-5-carboxymethylaminomethyl(34) synthesis GTPase MnmE n=1 Tax=Paracoccus sp. SCSIO 75233 TaxID=3017782 RepID=UPI0022EFFDA3|nr:tRNA uridine-5-carboxymethylaminomethyl(34) synthesis GTPase MnmE [Paracoccus sp. SCSIO 75233]WBU52918.1 tRNA uridine-5-carboxymethylaminomethyl(34) synthesis GTPase MnmE [Paracoccus sp. SCSIO 75233]